MSKSPILVEKEYSFDLNRYEVLELIGKGSFGEVYKVKEKKTDQIFAAKIQKAMLDDKEIIRGLIREVNIISKLNHPSIVKFIGFSPIDFGNDPRPVIITEYITNGTLTEQILLERRGVASDKWNDTTKLIILYGIASAMSFLHSNKIIHRDLKPENILMDENLYPKITDFKDSSPKLK